MSNTFTIFRGHAYTYRPGTPEGPTTKAIAYLAYSGRDKLFVVKAVNEHGKTRCLLWATDFNEAVKYYEAEFPGIGAKRNEFNNPNKSWKKFSASIDYRTLLSYLTEWKDTLVKGQTHHTDWERNHDNYKTEPRPTPPAINFHTETYEDNEYPKVLGGYIWPDMARIIAQTRENSWEQWEVFTAPPVPKMKKELVMGHIWGAPGRPREVVLVTRRGSCYAVMEKTPGSSELVSIGHVHSLSEANKILDRYAKRPHKEGEFLRLDWNSSAPIRPSVFLQEIAEILPDSEFLKTHELTPVKKTPEKLEEATPKEQEREKLGDFKPELHGWYLSGAAIQAESRYNGAFLLWSRHIKGKQEYGVQALGFPQGGGPDLYATTSLTDAIAHAHQVCRSQRIYHERRGESRKLDGINAFGVGISNLQDTFTINRTPFRDASPGLHTSLNAYKEKSAEVRRVLEILTYEQSTALDEASERVAKQLEKERERLVGPSVLEAVPIKGPGVSAPLMAAPMAPTAGEMMQKQIEAMKTLGVSTEAMRGSMAPPNKLPEGVVYANITASTPLVWDGVNWKEKVMQQMQKAEDNRQYQMGLADPHLPKRPGHPGHWSFDKGLGCWVVKDQNKKILGFYGEYLNDFETIKEDSLVYTIWDPETKEFVTVPRVQFIQRRAGQPVRDPEAQRQYELGMNDFIILDKNLDQWQFDERWGYWVLYDRGEVTQILLYGADRFDYKVELYDVEEYMQVWDPAEERWVYHDMKNFKRSKEGEQTMATTPNPKNPTLENFVPAVLTESQRTILDKYQDEAKAIDLEKAIKDMEMLKAEHDKALAQAKVESRKLKTTKKKRATMMQTMSLSAVFTLLTYLVLARVFGRPVPNLQLTQPKRRLRKGKRRHREEEVSEPIAALLPPRAEEVPSQGSRTRNRSKVRA